MRSTEIIRKTSETEVELALNLDGSGAAVISSGCGFLDHMLELLAHHGCFDLTVKCIGDVNVDYHHTTEDIGITLGSAFARVLGDKRGINRYGSIILPMDEALVMTAVDVSGRAHLSFDVTMPSAKVGDFDTELVEEFLLAFVREAGITLHVRMLAGKNTHHIIEAVYKSVARALREAVAIDHDRADIIPSSKGVI